MIRLEPRAAHGDEGVGGGAVQLAVPPIGRVVGGGGVLHVHALAGQESPGLQDAILRSVDEPDAVLPRVGQYLGSPHGLADGDALRQGGRGPDGSRVVPSLVRRLQQGVAVFALQGDDLGEGL